tara:strand:- start:871 stop:1542 length:672 start_codon:yes stop_codon:yes gene_type:complete
MPDQKFELYAESVTIVGGAGFSTVDLDECLVHCPILIAADGGANDLINEKYQPEYIIGDLDSLKDRKSWETGLTKVIQIEEQESTDFEKCLYSVQARNYLCVGFVGGRSDHFLSACTSLVKYNCKCIILVGPNDVIFHVPKIFEIDLPVKTRLSLFPMQEITGIEDVGLRWPISGIKFDPATRVGTSNITTERTVKLILSNEGMLMMLPRSCLRIVIKKFQKL